MSRMILGQPFDIHTGGIDHISIHHNNEIAQSEAAYDQPLAHYWMHNEFITIKNSKMAKSVGNHITLDTLKEEHISPLAYRYWLLTAHYRSPVNFTYSAVKSAQTALIRLLATISSFPAGGNIVPIYKNNFQTFINNDLDIPQALALTWELMKDNSISPADKRATVIDFDRVLGFGLDSFTPITDIPASQEEVPIEIKVLAEAREEARKSKDWTKADTLRTEIQDRGFDVVDNDTGFSVIPR